MRVFAGLPLPERTRETIAAWMNTWEAERKALKPVQPTGLHVTLHFFGEVDEGGAEEIGKALAAIRRNRIEAALGGLSHFPRRGKTRVFAIDFDTGGEEIASLYNGLMRSLGDIGYAPVGRPFVPHITVARVRRGAAVPVLPSFEPNRGTRLTLDRLVLFQSILKPTGAEYHPLTTVPFDQ